MTVDKKGVGEFEGLSSSGEVAKTEEGEEIRKGVGEWKMMGGSDWTVVEMNSSWML